MQVRTFSLTLVAARDAVFNYLADIEHLPHWAYETCERVRLHRGSWLALTSRGELGMQLHADASTGVIDVCTRSASGETTLLPLRVVALGERATLVTLVYVQPADQSDARFAADMAAHQRELEALTGYFGGGTVHASEPTEWRAHGVN